jgi:hypothetical protein
VVEILFRIQDREVEVRHFNPRDLMGDKPSTCAYAVQT